MLESIWCWRRCLYVFLPLAREREEVVFCDHRRLVTSYCVLRPSWREQKSCRRENEFAGDGFCERDEVMREGFYYWILDFSELVGKFASFFFIIIWMGTNEISVRITVTLYYNLVLIRMLLADVALIMWGVRVLKSRLYLCQILIS